MRTENNAKQMTLQVFFYMNFSKFLGENTFPAHKKLWTASPASPPSTRTYTSGDGLTYIIIV